jgi:transcriptional regulator with XRE-family HTH domain
MQPAFQPARLRHCRTAKGLTLAEAGALIGATRQQWHAWETGRHKPQFETVLKLAAAVGCPPGELHPGLKGIGS